MKNQKKDWYTYPMFGGDDISEENKIIRKIEFMQSIKGFYNKKNFRFILDGDRQKVIKDKNKDIKFIGSQDQEAEDLIDKDFYLACIEEVYYPLFIEERFKIEKLKAVCFKVKKESNSKITKFLQNEFKENRLGGFDKVEVAKCIKRKLISASENLKYFKDIQNTLKSLKEIKNKKG